MRSEVRVARQSAIFNILREDPELLLPMMRQCGLCALGERLLPGALNLASVDFRMKLYLLSRAMDYGKSQNPGPEHGTRIVTPSPIQRKYPAKVINTSTVSPDKHTAIWKNEGLLVRHGTGMAIRPRLLAGTPPDGSGT